MEKRVLTSSNVLVLDMRTHFKLKYRCPYCNDKLWSEPKGVIAEDFCPACRGHFYFADETQKEIAAKLEGRRLQAEADRSRAEAKELQQRKDAEEQRRAATEKREKDRQEAAEANREAAEANRAAVEANRAAKEQAIASEASHRAARIASSCEEQAEKSYASLSTTLMISRIGVPLAIFLFAMNGGSQNPFLLIGLGLVWEVFFHVVSFFVHALMSCQMLLKQIRR